MRARSHLTCIPVLASDCAGSFNPEPAATAQFTMTHVAVGSGLNDLKTLQRNNENWTSWSIRVNKSRAQRQMDDLCRGIEAQRQPVADAVGDDQGSAVGLGLTVEAGPVAEHQRPEADVVREHELTAMRVAGNRQGESRGSSGIERMRVVGHKDREGARGDLARQLPNRSRNHRVIAAPGQAEQLDSWPRIGTIRDSLTSRGTRARARRMNSVPSSIRSWLPTHR